MLYLIIERFLPLVLLRDFQRLVAYGLEGIAWRHDRLGDDDLEVTSASIDGVRVQSRLATDPGDVRRTFELDAATGTLRSPA
ncbi:MAG TPA: hypothetical protein VIE46_06125 [Gemmatimonadales bacterium]